MSYRNVALNPNEEKGKYPKAITNSEVPQESFLARNVIDGVHKNYGHGIPFPSWGPWKQNDSWLKIEFEKEYEIDKTVVYIRADFTPYTSADHDSWWRSGTLEFSDGTSVAFKLERSAEAQTIEFPKRKVEWVKFTKLVPEEDKWCGFTEVEVWGK